MKRNILLSIIIIAIVMNITCDEDIFLSKKDYTIITSKPIELISDSGVVVSSEIIGELSNITSYGLIWDQDKNNINIDNIKKIIYEETPKTVFFETYIDFAILPDKRYYLKTFAYTDNYFVYGNRVTFLSKGVKPPVITSITPEYGSIGDDIVITGSNFINNNDTAVAKIENTELLVEKCTKTKIYAKIPITEKGLKKISVELLGKESSQDFNILSNWTRIADLPIKTSLSVSFVLNNIAYVGTGSSSDGPINNFWKYNSVTDSWIQIANFPGSPRYDAVSFNLNGFGYVGVGNYNYTDYTDFWKYNPNSDTWTQVADLILNNVYYPISFTLNDNAYVGNRSELWKYNSIADSWTQLANLPVNLYGGGLAFTLNGIAYISQLHNLWEYNPVSDSWIQLADNPGNTTNRSVAFTINNSVYIGTSGNRYYEFWKYNPETNSSSQLDIFPRNIWDGIAFTLNGKAYVGSGRYKSNSETYYSDAFWEFNPKPLQ